MCYKEKIRRKREKEREKRHNRTKKKKTVMKGTASLTMAQTSHSLTDQLSHAG